MTSPENVRGYLTGGVTGPLGGYESVREARFYDAREGDVTVKIVDIQALELEGASMIVRMKSGQKYNRLMEYSKPGYTGRWVSRRTFQLIDGERAIIPGELAERSRVILTNPDSDRSIGTVTPGEVRSEDRAHVFWGWAPESDCL